MAEEGFRIARAFVTVDPDAADFSEKLKAAVDEAVAGASASVPIGADTGELDAGIDEARAKLDDLTGEERRAKLGLDKDDFDTEADDASGRLDSFDGRSAKARLDLDADDFDVKADDARAKLDEFDDRDATSRLDLDKADFDAEIDDAEARLDELEARSATVSLRASGGGAGAAGGGAEGGGGLLGGITGGVAALMPGIGGAAMGLGALAGTGALALGGVFKAVSAAHQAAMNIGMTSQQLAATEFANSVQIQQAQAAIGQAHEQAAEDAVNSAQQIEQAEQAVGQAEHSLSDAQFSEQQAQVSLTEARIQARLTLQQLQDQLRESALAEQSASLAVQQAQYQQQLTDQNAYSTALDRQQAALAVKQAEEQLTLAQQGRKNATMEATGQDKQYFDGQQQVIQAEHALKDAQYGVQQALQQVTDAQRALKVTEQDVAFTQQRDAQAVTSAQQNLTDTIKEQQLQMAATKASQNQAAQQFARDMATLSPAARGLVNQILSMRGAWRSVTTAAQTAVAPGLTIFLRGVKSLMPEISFAARDMGRAISGAFGSFGKQMQTSAFRDVFQGLVSNGVQFASTVLPAFAGFAGELAKIGSARGAVSGLADLLAGVGQGLTGLAAQIGHVTPEINQILSVIGKVIAQAGPALGMMLGTALKVISPIFTFLNGPGGGPFVHLLGDILAGYLAWKVASFAVIGPVKSAFGALKGGITWLKELPGNIKGWWGNITGFFTKFGAGASKVWGNIASTASSAWSSVTSAVSSAVSGIGSALSSAGTAIAGFGSRVYSTMASAGSAVVSFVATMGARLAEGTAATVAWLAEHTAAAATFIAENVAMATSATAAFIAENAATLGLAAVLTALVAGIVYLATHWHQAWDGMKDVTLAAWHDGIEPAIHGIGALAEWLWHNVFDPVYQGILGGTRSFMSAFHSAWNAVGNFVKAPVNFLIKTVYDDGIRRFWDDLVGAVGMHSLDLPYVSPLAKGGVLPGYAPGHDSQLALLSPGEGVLVPQAVRAIGPGTVHALNAAYGGGNGPQGSGVPRFGGGGILGDVGNFVGSIGSGILSGIKDAYTEGRIIAALASGNTTAFTNAVDALIHTKASANLGKLLIALPRALMAKGAQELMSMLSGGGGINAKLGMPGGSSGAIGNLPANWQTIAGFLAGHGFTKYAAAGTAGNIFAESGGNPEILEIGGGGGGGLIQWTPYPPGYITGNYSQDLMTQLHAILSWGGGPGLVNRATSPSNAAVIYQDYYERPASLTASIAARMASANAVYAAMGWAKGSGAAAEGSGGKFDSGGWWPSGMPGMNTTGRPEAVLDPDMSQAFVTWVKAQFSGQSGGGSGPGTTVKFIYNGPQTPTPEMQANMRRDLAMTLGG